MALKPADLPKDPEPILHVLQSHAFRKLWISQICSQLSINMMIFLIALMLYQRTQSNAAVSGLFIAYGLPSLIFGMAAGAIVDRVDRRFVLIISHASRAACILLLYLFSFHIAAIYLLVFANAIITQLTTPAEIPLIPQFVPKDLLVTANSLFSFTFYSAMAIGFMTAGPVLRLLGAGNAYMLMMILFMVAAVSVYALPKGADGWQNVRRLTRYNISYIVRRILLDLENGIRYVSHSSSLKDALLLLTMTQIILMLLGTLGPGFSDKILRIDVRDASLYVVGPVILGILAGVLWLGNVGYRYTPERLIRLGVIGVGSALMAVSGVVALANTVWYALIPQYMSLLVAFALLVLLGFSNSFLDVPSNSILQKEASGEMRGRVYGMLSASVGGAGILPIIVSGVLADIIGVGKVIFLLGALIFLYGLYVARYYKIPSNS